MSNKGKIGKLDLNKIKKTSGQQRTLLRKWKDNPKNICKLCLWYKFISRMYKEHQQLNNKKINNKIKI